MDLAARLEKLKQAYAAAGTDCGKQLLPPVIPQSLARAEQRLGVVLPPSLRELYQIHGGQRYVPPGVTGLFGRHRLYTPAGMVRAYRMLLDCCLLDPLPQFPPARGECGYFHPRLLPFAGWDAYDLCIDAQSGRVWEFEPHTGLSHGVRFPSIAAVVRRLLAQLKDGQEPAL